MAAIQATGWRGTRSCRSSSIPSYPDYLRGVADRANCRSTSAPTHYVGVAGIGLDAASYSRNDPATKIKRGIFSNDGSASLDEIRKGRGLSNTMAMIQIPHDGVTGVSPWIAGGGATLRGVPEKNSIAPFILSRDKNDKPIEHQGKRGTFVLMADGSARFVDQTVSDDVFKAMATVQGPAPENFNPATNPSTPLLPAPEKEELPQPPAVMPVNADAQEIASPRVRCAGQVLDRHAGRLSPWKYVPETKKPRMDEPSQDLCLPRIRPRVPRRSFLSLDIEEKKLDTDEQKRSLITQDLAKNVAEGTSKKASPLTEDIKPNLSIADSLHALTFASNGKGLPDGGTLMAHPREDHLWPRPSITSPHLQRRPATRRPF